MKRSLKRFCLILFALQAFVAAAEAQEKYDIVYFKAPTGWQKSLGDDAIQFSKQVGTDVGIMMLFRSVPTNKSSRETFDASWDTIVKGLFDRVDAPQMQPAGSANGWTLENGAAVVEKTGSKAVANLISATGNGKVVNLLIIYNSESFQSTIDAFTGSINLPRVQGYAAQTAQTSTGTNNANPSSIVGLWVFYTTESGGVINGINQLTGGYMRREYLLKGDGTYVFRAKHWLVYVKDILYVYETGKWSVNGNQLTITPTQGRGEWWGKSASGRTVGWGKLVKASAYRIEKVPYTFELHNSGNEIKMKLRSSTATERDGSSGSETSVHEFWYELRNSTGSLIDSPPR